MSQLFIDTDAVRRLAAGLRRAADDADGLRSRVLGALVAAELPDEAGTGVELHGAAGELAQVARVLDARADQAEYPLRDTVALALHAQVDRALDGLLVLLDPTGAAEGRGVDAARSVRRAGAHPDADLVSLIREHAADPSFARGFGGELTLAGAADAVLAASWAERYHPAATGQDRARWAATRQLLLEALGTVFATASLGAGQLALPGLGQAGAWADAITTEPSGGARAGQGAALALVLASGPFDDQLLTDVSTAVERYERAHSAGSAPLWAPRSQVDGTYFGPVAADGTRAYDPLATLLGALGSRPAAARAYLASGSAATAPAGDGTVALPERLAYLLGRRRWPADDAAGLGAALRAATTGVRDRTDAGLASAQLASQTVALVGRLVERSGGWRPTDGLRPGLTALLVSYMPDVFRAVQSDSSTLRPGWFEPDNPAFPPLGPYGATFRRADLGRAVEAVGTDPDQARRLLGAVLGTSELLLGHAIDVTAAGDPTLAADFLTDVGGPSRRVSLALVDNAVGAGGQTLGFVVQHAYAGDRAGQARVAQAQRDVSELLQAAVRLPVLPAVAGPWGTFALTEVTTRLVDAWAAGRAGDAAQVYGDIDAAIAGQLRRQVLDQLAAKHLLWPLVPVLGYEPPPDAAFVADAFTGRPLQPLRFDPDTGAFQDWVTRYAPATWLQVHVQLFYADAFPRIR